VRSRSKAVALSVSLVIAASGAGTASATPRTSAQRDDAAPGLIHDASATLADDDGTSDDDASAGDQAA
jgi:hypothetical protein